MKLKIIIPIMIFSCFSYSLHSFAQEHIQVNNPQGHYFNYPLGTQFTYEEQLKNKISQYIIETVFQKGDTLDCMVYYPATKKHTFEKLIYKKDTIFYWSRYYGLDNCLTFPLHSEPGESLPDLEYSGKPDNEIKVKVLLTERKIAKPDSITTPAGKFLCDAITCTFTSQLAFAKTVRYVKYWFSRENGIIKQDFYKRNGKKEILLARQKLISVDKHPGERSLKKVLPVDDLYAKFYMPHLNDTKTTKGEGETQFQLPFQVQNQQSQPPVQNRYDGIPGATYQSKKMYLQRQISMLKGQVDRAERNYRNASPTMQNSYSFEIDRLTREKNKYDMQLMDLEQRKMRHEIQ
jgi:hypothetical protein